MRGKLPEEPLDYYLEWAHRFWEAPFLFGLARVGPDLAGKRILEIGARSGRMCLWFARQGARVVGGDIRLIPSPALQRADEGTTGRVNLVRLRGERLPFRDGSFDVVFTKGVFVVLRKEAALAEMLRVLAPGGYLWLLENMKDNPVAAAGRFLRVSFAGASIRHIRYVTYDELESYAPAFSRYEHREFHFLTPLFRVVPVPRAWLRRLVAWESRALARFRPLARRAWLACVVGRK